MWEANFSETETSQSGSVCEDDIDPYTYVYWNRTSAGNTAALQCSLFTTVASADSADLAAYRVCDTNGSWLDPDYSQCINMMRLNLLHNIMVGRILCASYIFGGGTSMVLLSATLFIFCFFKSLHCKRIWIHCNLVITFMMRLVFLLIRLRKAIPFIVNITDQMLDEMVEQQLFHLPRSQNAYLLYPPPTATELAAGPIEPSLELELETDASDDRTASIQSIALDATIGSSSEPEANVTSVAVTIDFWTEFSCKADVLCNWFTFLCIFFWMFVEAAYLYARISISVFDGEHLLFKRFCMLGWGGPLLWVIISGLVLQFVHKVPCWEGAESTQLGWLLYGPPLALLVANVYFMIAIITVLVTKMKGMKTAETEQIRVALRAIGFLVPLFGVTFLVMAVPMSPKIIDIYRIINAVLQSLQGAAVSLLYCFMNHEVRDAIRNRIRRFESTRNQNSMAMYVDRDRDRSIANPTHRVTSRPAAATEVAI